MKFEEFMGLKKKEKIRYLLDYWELNDQVLMGKVRKKDEKYIIIEDIYSIDGKEKRSPFYSGKKMWAYCNIDDTIEISVGDNVAFKFDLNIDIDKLKESPIRSNKKDLINLKDINYTSLKSYNEILHVIEKNKINPLVTKVLVKEDVERELELLLEENKSKLNNLDKDFEEKNIELNEVQSKISAVNEELEEKIRLKNKFKEYEFNYEEERKIEEVSGLTDINKEDYINYIQSYLANRDEKRLFYKQEVLAQFYAGLCTNQLLVLSGKPGTGKTSLVEGFCNAIGAKLKVISVQPNWTDNQDLIGFYNPVENTYIPTQFLDAVIEAKENPNTLYVICLDEMNLAYVEYYFSEFLSKLQSENKSINLYSDYIFQQAKKELYTKVGYFVHSEDMDDSTFHTLSEKLKNKDINEYFKLKKQWDSIMRYPSNLEIPSNLRFVGTINKDETTKDFSPKVVDRSYIMEVKAYNQGEFDDIDFSKEYKENLYITAEEFKENIKNIPQELSIKLASMKVSLKKVNVELTNRIENQIKQLCASDMLKEKDLLDAIVSAKILPKLNVEIEDENIINEIEKQLNGLAFSESIFRSMKEYWNESGILTFWR